MGGMVMKLGVIGLSPGNGHPFSFSAIINGYSDEGFARSGWPVIHNYLRAKDSVDVGVAGVKVTHAWTQDRALTRTLCAASLIDNAVSEPDDMIGEVDAVLLARDDEESHFAMAMPFLEKGIPVFVDKPLSLVPEQLRAFRPHLEAGRLMSCSGLMHGRELDDLRAGLPEFGEIRLVRGTVFLDWVHYGVHMVDAILSLGLARPVAVTAARCTHHSMAIELQDGGLVQIDALGKASKNFRIDVFGSERDATVQIFDNFHAFRRTLLHFVRMVEEGRPQIDPDRVLTSMRILIAGVRSREENRTVRLDDIII
jgi:predicted dehydrogenase